MRRAFAILPGLLVAVLCNGGEPQGQAALALALNRLPVTAAVLHIGAHPDDEHTALLAYLARGRGVRTAYLSATRGEGGQNLLGAEQYEALGLLRTEELLAARRLDGAEQFFTRAYDFGYCRNAEEALARWSHGQTLADFVRVIRRFRPQVIVSRFAGGPQDGHGQHAAAGLLAREAFRAAADPARFPEQIHEGLEPWQAAKLYITVNRYGPAAKLPLPKGALEIEVGDYSPLLGRSYAELAMEGRSLHRSQAMGVPQRKGPRRLALLLVDTRLVDTALPGTLSATLEARRAQERDLLDGVDAKITPGPLLDQIERAQAALAAGNSADLIGALARGLELARRLPTLLRAQKEAEFSTALALAHGLAVEALAGRAELVPGESYQVRVTTWNRARVSLEVKEIALDAPASWTMEPGAWTPTALEYNRSTSRLFTVTLPLDAPPWQPYWLRLSRQGDSYQVADPSLIGLPHNPPLLEAQVRFHTAGVKVRIRVPVEHRYVDQIYGQVDRPIAVVPPVAAWLHPPVTIFPESGERPADLSGRAGRPAPTPAEREITLRLRNNRTVPSAPEVRASPGWRVRPQRLTMPSQGEELIEKLRVRPEGTAAGVLQVVANGGVASGYQLIQYPHIRPQYWFRPAQTRLVPVALKVAQNLRVGYIMGAGDQVPEALRQLGVAVHLLTAEELLAGELSRFDAIVAGIRAYAVRKDLVAANRHLLDYVRQGGVYIVQYNSRWPGRGRQDGQFPFAPYWMRQQRRAPRVSREEQPVEILVPGHPLLTTPNRITAADFAGWVQERGLYFMSEWAPEYTPLLASHDPSQPPQHGGMLVARFGKGLYVYTGYSWFRQLPAGVPGAYRIWANLLSAARLRK